MTPYTEHGEAPVRQHTPPEAPAERAEEIRARMEALLKRLPPESPERRES